MPLTDWWWIRHLQEIANAQNQMVDLITEEMRASDETIARRTRQGKRLTARAEEMMIDRRKRLVAALVSIKTGQGGRHA